MVETVFSIHSRHYWASYEPHPHSSLTRREVEDLGPAGITKYQYAESLRLELVELLDIASDQGTPRT